MTGILHIRHGVVARHPFGYRAVREVDGARSWIGPWRVSEADADRDVANAQAALREAMDDAGAEIVSRPNPDLGVWLPTTREEIPE